MSESETGAGGGGRGDGQFSSSEVSVTGSNTHPIPSISVSYSVPATASAPATTAPVPVPVSAPLADVPLTAVDADRIVQSDYLSPYCTEIAIRYSTIIPLLFASSHFICTYAFRLLISLIISLFYLSIY